MNIDFKKISFLALVLNFGIWKTRFYTCSLRWDKTYSNNQKHSSKMFFARTHNNQLRAV